MLISPPYPRQTLFKYVFVPIGSRHRLLGTGSSRKFSSSHDLREHFSVYVCVCVYVCVYVYVYTHTLGRLSTAGATRALEEKMYWEAASLFQGQGAGEDSK